MLQCHGKTGDSMVRTVAAFNQDPHFANAFPLTEEHTEKDFRFNVDIDYRPAIARIVE
jgi:hypothetical protein